MLGTPAYTVFAGELGAVDEYLIHQGRMQVLTQVEELKVGKKDAAVLPPLLQSGRQLVQQVTDAFLSAAEA